MKWNRLLALGLALGLTVSLAACGSKAAEEDSVSPSPEVSDPTGAPTETVTQEPTDSVAPTHPETPAPGETDEPTNAPATSTPDCNTPVPETPGTSEPIGDPTAPATPEPTPEVTPAPAAMTAAEVYSAVSKSAGETSATMDASAVMENFYNLSADDLEDFVLYIPEASANIEEIFIVKAKSGKVSDVKAACESRLQGLREDAEFYPATGAYVADYKLETQGDWVMFCVCPDSAGAVKAFKDCLK